MAVQKDKKKVEHKVVLWTTGFSLPEPGGALDQPQWLIETFRHFLSGDHTAAYKQLKS